MHAVSSADRSGSWPTRAMRLLRSLANNVSTADAPSPGLSSVATCARGQPATSVKISAVWRARTSGLVRRRSGALHNVLSPSAAFRDRFAPTAVSGLAESSGHRWWPRAYEIACRMSSNSMDFRALSAPRWSSTHRSTCAASAIFVALFGSPRRSVSELAWQRRGAALQGDPSKTLFRPEWF